MNPTFNLAVVFLGPLVAVIIVAMVRWLVDRDPVALGHRLRRWGFWAVICSYGFFAVLMAASMVVEGESYPLATALAAAALFAGLPLGTWAWQRAGGQGLPAAVSMAVGALCALALAVMVAPQFWRDVQEGGFPLASVVALAIGASAAVWGRTTPIPGGAALLVAGVVPLGTALIASAAADIVLAEMFLPMPMFAVLGLTYLASAWIAHRAARHERALAAPGRARDRTMTA